MGMTAERMVEAILRTLHEKTGKTLEQWMKLIRSEAPESRKDAIEWLKSKHGLGHVTASQIVRKARAAEGAMPATADELLAGQYAGAKASLEPLYRKLAGAARGLGADVEEQVKKTSVAFARGSQFAIVQASTKERVDLGLRLAKAPKSARLKAAGSLGSDSITHKVELRSREDVDADVLAWLRTAYEQRAAT
jgi:hypothetical protein